MKKKEKLGKTQYTNQVSRVEGGGGKMNEINERGNEEKIQRKTKKKLGKVKKKNDNNKPSKVVETTTERHTTGKTRSAE